MEYSRLIDMTKKELCHQFKVKAKERCKTKHAIVLQIMHRHHLNHLFQTVKCLFSARIKEYLLFPSLETFRVYQTIHQTEKINASIDSIVHDTQEINTCITIHLHFKNIKQKRLYPVFKHFRSLYTQSKIGIEYYESFNSSFVFSTGHYDRNIIITGKNHHGPLLSDFKKKTITHTITYPKKYYI